MVYYWIKQNYELHYLKSSYSVIVAEHNKIIFTFYHSQRSRHFLKYVLVGVGSTKLQHV